MQKKCVFDALSDAVILFTLRGIQAVNSTRFDVGSALDWTRLDFRKRKEAMEKTLKAALLGREGSNKIDNEVIVNLNNKKVMTIEHLAKLSTDRFVDNLLPPYRLFFAQ
ncbi:hypothetical protein A8139_07625 [Marinomonas primoryensis]|uniref:Uncharacterized protein n=1 Tax=Marinomonas primoryensis TaxID=178399 RepID=A0A2Z4PRX6_9GAMM|nr:hypothetical protein [Marinomonas primoryensis]AWX99878.1 hypothetical protein A8139_07625 [Marinomonas primoryensis]